MASLSNLSFRYAGSLFAQTNGAAASVLTGATPLSLAPEALEEGRKAAESGYIADVKDRLSKQVTISNEDGPEPLSLAAARYRKRAEESLAALARLSGGKAALDPVLGQMTEKARGEAFGAFVLNNMSRIDPSVAKLSVTVEYADVVTGEEADAVAIRRDKVSGVRTGDGGDAVSIVADQVFDVKTDADLSMLSRIVGEGFGVGYGSQLTYANADSLAISARVVKQVMTGGGGDAIAIEAELIDSVNAGAGDDAVAIRGGLVEFVDGGAGDDNIDVQAVIASRIRGGEGDDVISVEARRGDRELFTLNLPSQDGAAGLPRLIAPANADVQGGAGDDVIRVRAEESISVEAGTGDDRLSLEGGTVALKYAAGDGDDVVSLGGGVDLWVDLGRDVEYSVERSGDALTLTFEGGGSMRFDGLEAASALVVQGGRDGSRVLYQTGSLSVQPVQAPPAARVDLLL